MTSFEVLKWMHLLAAATWTGGLIVLGLLIGAMRKAGADRQVLKAMAQRFGLVSWIAMAVAVATGFRLYTITGAAWVDFTLKGTLIVLSIAAALIHQFTARNASPALRGIQQVVILVLAVAIFGAAVILS